MTLRRRIQAALDTGDEREAIRLACTIPDHDLGGQGPAIRKAREAMTRPAFQQQLNRNPEALIRDGLAALEQHLKETRPMTKKLDAKNTKTKTDKAPKTKATKKAAKKTKEADPIPAAVSPAPEQKAAPAPRSGPAAANADGYVPLELTWDEINGLTSQGNGVWRKTIKGAACECKRDPKNGDEARGFTATISYSGRTTTARGKGFFAAVRAAIRQINEGQ